jgi:hypothetical protein
MLICRLNNFSLVQYVAVLEQFIFVGVPAPYWCCPSLPSYHISCTEQKSFHMSVMDIKQIYAMPSFMNLSSPYLHISM